MNKKDDPGKEVKFLENTYLPSLFVDVFRVSVRKDSISVLGFYSDLPSGVVEQVRVVTPIDRLKAFVDLICKQLNYYPVKPGEQAADVKKAN